MRVPTVNYPKAFIGSIQDIGGNYKEYLCVDGVQTEQVEAGWAQVGRRDYGDFANAASLSHDAVTGAANSGFLITKQEGPFWLSRIHFRATNSLVRKLCWFVRAVVLPERISMFISR